MLVHRKKCLIQFLVLNLVQQVRNGIRLCLLFSVRHSLKVFAEVARPSVKPPVGIKVRPVLHADLLNDRFINAMLTQHFFLGFFPDTPFPVLTSVVICHSLFPPIRIFENVKIQIG